MIYSAGTGLSLFFFDWWYAKPGFTLAFFVVFIFCLFIHQIRFRTILLGSLMFVLCAYPITFMEGTGNVQYFLKGYFDFGEVKESVVNVNLTNLASFPNAMTTISEVGNVQFSEVFRRILSKPIFDWVGLLAFFVLGIFRWRVLLPLAPMLALGLLSFQSSNRFIMYLAPFIGIGLGWVLSVGIEGMFYFLTRNHVEGKGKNKPTAKGAKKNVKISHNGSTDYNGSTGALRQKFLEADWFGWVRQATLYLGMGVFFWLISSQTAIPFVPAPSIPPRIFKTFLEVKKRVSDESKLLTWWDYGHTLNDIGFGTFHDGGNQVHPKTYFIARGLISHDGEELYDITQFLAAEGNGGIAKNNTSPEALLRAVRNPEYKPWNPIYLFFTADMTGKYGAISKLGSWDIVKGGSKPRGYQNLACNKITSEEMNCRGAKIDLKDGKINNQVPLKRMVFIRDGKVLREQEFGHAHGYTLQLLVAGRQIVEVQLIDEVVFWSNYNQMFLLGRYREDLYEETYNAFPFSRLFRFKF
jgi:dolichyl-diphosphooligosaccharide--protein glycosyltransferase